MAVRKTRPERSPGEEKDSPFLGPDSAFFAYLREEAKRLGPPLPIEEVRKMLDEELGDISLTDELLRMRHED